MGASRSGRIIGGSSLASRPLRSLHFPDYQQMITLLVQARNDAGLTQRALAQLLGKPHSYVSKIESGERRIDLVECLRFLLAAKADTAQFVVKVTRIIRKIDRAARLKSSRVR